MKRRITSTHIPEHPLCRPADAAFFVLFVEARLGEKIGERREPMVRRPDWEIDEGESFVDSLRLLRYESKRSSVHSSSNPASCIGSQRFVVAAFKLVGQDKLQEVGVIDLIRAKVSPSQHGAKARLPH